MSLSIPVRPIEIRDYAKTRGWTLLPSVGSKRLYIMTNPAFERRQLVFPMDASAPDYEEAIELIVAKLSSLEDRPVEAVVKSLLEVSDDGIAFRITTPRQEERFVPLSFAALMVNGAEQLLLSSACSVLRPQTHHPRMSRIEAQQLLAITRFRHTQPGSFVLNISCPVQGIESQPTLLPDVSQETEAPFVRRAVLTIERSLSALVDAIERDTLTAFVDQLKVERRPLVSSNFCEGLLSFADEKLQNSLDVTISWASAIPRPPARSMSTTIRFQPDYFPRVEEVRRELRANQGHIDDVFLGTVEALDGEMGENSMRAGEVILSLLSSDGEQIKARVSLDADQYANAVTAHVTDGFFVSIAGRLHPGRQPRQITNVSHFTLLEPRPSAPGS